MINVDFIPGGLYRIINASDMPYDYIIAYQNTVFDDSSSLDEVNAKLRHETVAGSLEIGELVIYIKYAKDLRLAHVASSLGIVIIPTFCLKREK